MRHPAPEPLVNVKLLESSKQKLQLLKLLHKQKHDYAYLDLLLSAEYERLRTEITTMVSSGVAPHAPTQVEQLQEAIKTLDLDVKVELAPVEMRASGSELRSVMQVDDYRLTQTNPKKPE